MPFILLDFSTDPLSEFGEENPGGPGQPLRLPSPSVIGFRAEASDAVPAPVEPHYYRHGPSLPYYSFYFDPERDNGQPSWLDIPE